MRTRTITTLLATTASLAVCAPAASADSIAYVKGGDIWLSTGDGSRQFQVTTTGGYSEVSQSDAGDFAALHGDKITHLDRQGKVLSEILTPVSTSSDANQQFKGPFDPVISPDGKKIAYTYYFQYMIEDPYCNKSTSCYNTRLYQGAGYTYPDRVTAWDEPGMRRQSGWIHADWVGNDLTMLSDPSMAPNHDVVMSSPVLGSDSGFTRWFSHPSAGAWRDADLSNDRTKLAGVTGSADDKITFAYVQGLPENGGDPHYPTQCAYETKDPAGGKFSSVSWSPDNAKLAYSDGGGISTVAIPTFGATYGDCGTPQEDVKLIIPGGTSPFWGPADVPAPRAPKPTENGTGGKEVGKTPILGKDNGGSIVVAPKPGGGGQDDKGVVIGPKTSDGGNAAAPALKLGAVLTKGLPVTVQVAGAGTLTVTVRSGGKTVAGAKGKAKQAGAKMVTAVFTKAARKKFAKAKTAKFSITTSFKPSSGGKTVKASASVTMKR